MILGKVWIQTGKKLQRMENSDGTPLKAPSKRQFRIFAEEISALVQSEHRRCTGFYQEIQPGCNVSLQGRINLLDHGALRAEGTA